MELTTSLENSFRSCSASVAMEDSTGSWSFTYADLEAAASKLYASLVCKIDSALVYYGSASPEYYVFAAACFRYGISFCPVSAENPVPRCLSIADALSSNILIVDKTAENKINKDDFCFVSEECCLGNKLKVLSRVGYIRSDGFALDENNREYYIATSGTTGVPKLVSVSHDNTLPFLSWAIGFYDVNSKTRWSQFSNIGFDLSIVDMLTTWVGGGTLVSISAGVHRIRPALAIKAGNITHWHSVPSIIPYLLQDGNQSISGCKLFTFCGEPLAVSDASSLSDRCRRSRIVNTYGPTEGTLFCSYHEYDNKINYEYATLPIGSAIPGWNFLYLPVGEYNLLVIVSNYISKGYVGVGSSSFSYVSFEGVSFTSFDTGDYFKSSPFGPVFSHRKDGMVKVNGNRVDTGEIEAHCKSIGLKNPVVVNANDRLVVMCEESVVDIFELREKLIKKVPKSFIPADMFLTSKHPRTSSGKIDRYALKKRILSDG